MSAYRGYQKFQDIVREKRKTRVKMFKLILSIIWDCCIILFLIGIIMMIIDCHLYH